MARVALANALRSGSSLLARLARAVDRSGRRDSPEFLYKYQSFDPNRPERASQVLSDHLLYFSSPAQFNDPLDCKARALTLEATEAEWERFFFDVAARARPEWSPDERRRNAAALAKSGVHRLPEARDGAYEGLQRLVNSVGVYCMSEEPADLLMWSHYANGHTGYCLQFRVTPNPSFFAPALPVRYARDFPRVRFARSSNKQKLDAVLLAKAENWAYEKEWRLILRDGPGLHRYPAELLEGIVLGARMPEKHKETLISLADLMDPRPTIYEARLPDDKYALIIGRAN